MPVGQWGKPTDRPTGEAVDVQGRLAEKLQSRFGMVAITSKVHAAPPTSKTIQANAIAFSSIPRV